MKVNFNRLRKLLPFLTVGILVYPTAVLADTLWNGTTGSDIYNANIGYQVGIRTSNPQVDLAIGDGDTGIQQQGDGQLAIFTNNSERARFNTYGLGLGTSPSRKLHIYGTGITAALLFDSGSGENDGQQIEWRSSSSSHWNIDQYGTSGQLRFFTELNNDTSGSVKMVLSQNGKIGVGTSSPSALVDVNGDLNAKWIHATDPGFHSLAGRVGINTTNDNANYNLLVNGKIRAKEIVVDTCWSDFVFDGSYNLRPLSEVDSYIDTYGHLPDIPSAQEVENNGVGLGEMDAKLIQKIEELTLYVIDLEQRIQELENE